MEEASPTASFFNLYTPTRATAVSLLTKVAKKPSKTVNVTPSCF